MTRIVRWNFIDLIAAILLDVACSGLWTATQSHMPEDSDPSTQERSIRFISRDAPSKLFSLSLHKRFISPPPPNFYHKRASITHSSSFERPVRTDARSSGSSHINCWQICCFCLTHPMHLELKVLIALRKFVIQFICRIYAVITFGPPCGVQPSATRMSKFASKLTSGNIAGFIWLCDQKVRLKGPYKSFVWTTFRH